MIELHRGALISSLLRRGIPKELIGLSVWVVHPFDDYPVPPRKLEKQVRRLSEDAARELRNALDGVSTYTYWAEYSTSILETYIDLAERAGSSYHWERWSEVLRKHQANS